MESIQWIRMNRSDLSIEARGSCSLRNENEKATTDHLAENSEESQHLKKKRKDRVQFYTTAWVCSIHAAFRLASQQLFHNSPLFLGFCDSCL